VSWFILGVAVLIAFILLSRWYVTASPKSLAKILKWVAFALVVLGVVWLAMTGKLWAAVAALPAMGVWFVRMFTGLRTARAFANFFGLGGGSRGWQTPGGGGNPGAGQGSDVRTRFVDLHLDHASGHVSGRVLEGQFAGRALESLSLSELLALYAEAQADLDSVRVLEGYLDRHEPSWRHHSGGGGGQEKSSATSSGGPMSREEAFKVLGLAPDADQAAIKAAHRRLMRNLHPDKGGSDYLAQQINRAKDVLMGK